MEDSILTSVKKILNIDVSNEVFDLDILIHINSVFSTLNQLGLGPDDGFMIEDASALWTDYLEDNLLISSVKTYMYLKVRLYFDPPQTSFLGEALNKQAQELEWRLNTVREMTEWEPPVEVEV